MAGKTMQPVTRGERTWDRSPELLYLARECGHTRWVTEDERDIGMDSIDCDAYDCDSEGQRRTWARLWAEQ